MKRMHFVWIWFLALITFGSGLLNLFSVTGPSLPHRIALLEPLFPLEFIHFSRFVTLLSGFALMVSSINIYRRKRRAFNLVCILASLSIISHLTKDLNHEQAILSLVLLVSLIMATKNFTVKSSIPDFRLGVLRLITALIIAFAYGVAGFWFLEKKEFGINFTLVDSMQKTMRLLTLQGVPEIVPQTRHARWFLDSMYIITAVTIGYSFFAIFRPVRYRYATLLREREHARLIVEQYGRHSLDYFKIWPDKSYFFSSSQNAFLAYRVGAHFAVVLGDPVGPENEIEELIRSFKNLCDENDWGIAFHQALPDFLPIYEKLGFKKLKIGDDAIVDLSTFTLEGKKGKELRHAVNKLEKEGFHTAHFDPPLSPEVLKQAKEISDDWLKIEGRRERRFTLGLFEPEYVRSTPILAVVDQQGTMQAFVNIIPSYRKGEATIDLMRHRSDSPYGVMDYLLIKLFFHCKEKGFQIFSLGMAPMSGFQEHENPSVEERAIHYFFQHMNFLFSFKGLRFYKAKFASWWEPKYVIYQNALDLARHAIAIGIISKF